MLGIAQHQLQRVLARRRCETGLGLARTEMKVAAILRDRGFEIERLLDVNQQMMMAAVRVVIVGVGDPHVAQTETAPEPASDPCTVVRPYEIQERVLWRLCLGRVAHDTDASAAASVTRRTRRVNELIGDLQDGESATRNPCVG